jgi:PadR family transcriptional regulator PadR
MGIDQPISPEAALLQALIVGPSFGLELIDRVRERTNGHVRLSQGTIYPKLRELESDGFVTSYEGEQLPERGGRPRRYYKLTAKGARAATQQQRAIAGLFGLVPEGTR